MNIHNKNAAAKAAMNKRRDEFRTRRVGARMTRNRSKLTQIFWGALLCAVAAVPVQAEEFKTNDKLSGVTSARYTMYFELIFGKPETDCKIDSAEWYAAMDRVASQSTKLRFVSRKAEADENMKCAQKEESEGKCHLDLKHHDDDLPMCRMNVTEPMPELDFLVTVSKIDNICVAEVAAKLTDEIVGQTKFKSTGRDNSVTRAEMWDSTYWVKNREQYLTRSVIEVSEEMMKNLVYEWTRGNCSDCDIIGDGGAPPKWVVEGQQWGPWPHDNIAAGIETLLPEEPARLHDNIAAGIEQDDAKLVVMCDPDKGRALHGSGEIDLIGGPGLILIFLREPRANWPKDAKVAVMTTADDGRRYSSPSYGFAIESTTLMLKNTATWELNVMGDAKKSFTIRAGAYTRTFPAVNLRKAVEPVLQACDDHW